jgi:lauroyl/myristoyl acyltransferase
MPTPIGALTRFTPHLVRGLRVLPWPLGEWVVAAVWVANGLARPWRRRWAWRWAARYAPGLLGRWRLTLALFANEGRVLSAGALLAAGRPEAVRRRLVVEGIDHLHAAKARGGVLLVGFHVGPIIDPLALAIAGYPVAAMVRHQAPLVAAQRQVAWRSFFSDTPYPEIDVREGGAAALYRAYRILRDGGAVFVTADGGGQVAFEVPVPGRAWAIRSGWLGLRRQAAAVTCPVLSHWQGARVVVSIRPPLPDPDPDPLRDLETCQRIISDVLCEHVRRFPAQCHVRDVGTATISGRGNRGSSDSELPVISGVRR